MSDKKSDSFDSPTPVEIDLLVNGESRTFTFEDAFSFGCSLLKKGMPEQAAFVFEKLQQFSDRGPRAGIMRAFCESARKNFVECNEALTETLPDDAGDLANMLHEAFVYYHVVSRKEALQQLANLANEHHELPTLCLLLGELLESENPALAVRCWKLAVRRDRPGGAVAQVARKRISQQST